MIEKKQSSYKLSGNFNINFKKYINNYMEKLY